MQFCDPKVLSVLARAVPSKAERDQILGEGQELRDRGAVGHNHLWFHRDAIDAMLATGDAAGAPRYATALEDYSTREPLPWSTLFVARGRALAAVVQGRTDEALRRELAGIRAALVDAEFKAFLPPVDAALASWAKFGPGREPLTGGWP